MNRPIVIVEGGIVQDVRPYIVEFRHGLDDCFQNHVLLTPEQADQVLVFLDRLASKDRIREVMVCPLDELTLEQVQQNIVDELSLSDEEIAECS